MRPRDMTTDDQLSQLLACRAAAQTAGEVGEQISLLVRDPAILPRMQARIRLLCLIRRAMKSEDRTLRYIDRIEALAHKIG